MAAITGNANFWGASFESFFDRSAVIARLERKERRVLGRTGSYTMRVMRNSMRPGGKKGRVSQPGEAPRYHGRGLLKRLIFFGLDKSSGAVFVGPELLASEHRPIDQKHKSRSRPVIADYRSGGKTLPEFVNDGGTATRITRYPSGRITKHTIRYEPRPFRDLAMPKGIAKLQELLASEPL